MPRHRGNCVEAVATDARAFSGKVETGFPSENATEFEFADREASTRSEPVSGLLLAIRLLG
jgi:hypothetical protein